MSHQSLADSSRLMDEMGIGPLWVRRHVEPAMAATVVDADDQADAVVVGAVATVAPVVAERVVAQMAPARVVAAPVRADDGLPSWLTEMDEADALPAGFIPDDDDEDEAPVIRINPAIAGMDWGKLKETVAACEQCGLCRGRKNTVFGVGDEKAKWLFIGEGPGRNEDLQGQPFIGPAGKLLDNMLQAIGLKRGDNAYIANIVKCRPTDENGKDRPPSAQEVAACLPYLQRQIALIQPTVLVALGKTAALSLLAMDPATPVSKLRGTVHRYQDLPLIVTYHPAYLLRQLGDKSKAWSDLCLAMSAYANSTP
jgi:uracil-DNA glycosylase family 4